MRVGIDFDNTIAGYDHVFVAAAQARGWVAADFYGTKRELRDTVRLLADACVSFDAHCARGIEPDRERIRALVERSLMLVTALAPTLGYDRAAAIAKKAHAEGLTLKEATLALGYLTAEEFDRVVRPDAMVGG